MPCEKTYLRDKMESQDMKSEETYELIEASVGFGELPIRLRMVKPEKHLANNLSGREFVSEGDATGGRSSPAALCLAWLSGAMGPRLRSWTVVELGAGTALAGVAAARYASRVYLTDGDTQALALARESVALNSSQLKAEVRVGPLAWGSIPDIKAPLSLAEVVWSRKEGSLPNEEMPRPVLVLGADLVYYPQGLKPLVGTIAQLLLLGGPGSLALLAFVPRMRGWLESLLDNAAAEALECGFIPVEELQGLPDLATGYFINARLMVMWQGSPEGPPDIISNFRHLMLEEVLAQEFNSSEQWFFPDLDVFH